MAESLAIVLTGAAVAIGVGVAIGVATPALRTGIPLPGELLARTQPNLIDLGIALAAGAAGGFVAVRTEASGALPGVGIAVALVPPLATAGITLGLGEFDLALGALLLFATNLVAIVLAAGLVLVGAGFAAFRDEAGERQSRYAAVVVFAAIFLIAIPLAGDSWQRIQQSTTLAAAADEIAAWAPDLTLEGVSVDRSQEPMTVKVTVTGEASPASPDLLAERLAGRLARPVDVDVVFVPVESGSAQAP